MEQSLNKQKIILKRSDRKHKKMVALIPVDDKIKKIHFGDKNYDDFLSHHDDIRKANYLARTKGQPSNNIMSPAFWSKNILWNKKTLFDSIIDTNDRYNLNISFTILKKL